MLCRRDDLPDNRARGRTVGDKNTDLTGVVLDGRYRLVEKIGQGGMGQVYAGMHDTLDRKVAVKVLLPRYAHDERFRERFLREARAASKVRHPNVVQILDFGDTPNDSVYFVMEFLEGQDLRTLLHYEGPLAWPRARPLLLQITAALTDAHDKKIIHRDLKPANFYVLEERGVSDFIKVLDFGIAKIATSTGDDSAQSLTGTGQVFGTAKYMAPEQAFGSSDDPRVDVYSVGVVAYEVLTGSIPFDGATAFEIITRHVNEPPVPLRERVPSIPADVERVVLQAMAKKPEERFATMEQLHRAFELAGSGWQPGSGPSVSITAPPPAGAPTPGTSLPNGAAPVPAPGTVLSTAVPSPAPATQAASTYPAAPGAAQSVATAPSYPSPSTSQAAPVPTEASTSVSSGSFPRPAGSGSAPIPPAARAPSGVGDDSGVGSYTTPIQDQSGPTASPTGPVALASTGDPTSETEQVAALALKRSRGGLVAVLVGAAAVVVGGLVFASGVFDSDDPPSPTVAAAPANVVETPEPASEDEPPPPPAAEPPSEPDPDPPTPSDADADEDDEVLVIDDEDEPPPAATEEPEPAPTPSQSSSAAKSSSKPRAPLTDAQVESRLARKLKRKCKAGGGSGTAELDLLVGSGGKVLSKSVRGASGDRQQCMTSEAARAKFPSGATRRLTVKVKF
ncbi:MAG: protein kinase [Myxococcota bacterium]